MANFPCHIVGSRVQLAVQNEASAHACAERQKNHIVAALPGTPLPFRQGTGIGVILQADGYTEPLPERGQNINPIPVR
jgi:hypothetical protein